MTQHGDKCPVAYGAQIENCTCVPPEKTPMSSAEKLLVAGFVAFTGGVTWRFGLDIAAIIDGALLIAGAIVMVRNGGDDASGP